MQEKLDIYKGKRILVTGHTGFKGSWLSIWLNELGAQVIGYALNPYTEKDNFVVSNLSDKIIDIRGDVRDYNKLKEVFGKHKPEVVFHLAAQSLVIEGYDNPKETFDVNIGGTVNVLENCRLSKSVEIIINITSDKCYENKEWVWGYRETDALGGYDPYSSSKACAEMVTRAYRNSFFNVDDFKSHGKALSTVRAGNVIGGGDWREDRIIPDCIRSLEKSEPIYIRNPFFTRPWQFMLEPLGGYLLLGGKMFEDFEKYCGAWNFGPASSSIITVKELVTLLLKKYGKGSWEHHPYRNKIRETTHLSLDVSKAKHRLGWNPCLSIEEAVGKTVDWYKSYRDISNMYDFCKQQIFEYMERQSLCK
jgi:CDP-glucose 4,6-dehydratase